MYTIAGLKSIKENLFIVIILILFLFTSMKHILFSYIIYVIILNALTKDNKISYKQMKRRNVIA